MTEHTIQNLAVACLRKIGFTVCVTSNRKRTSNTKGTPDTFVNIKGAVWISLEFKQANGKVSIEQLALQQNGMSYVVTSAEEAVQVCLSFRKKKL